MSRAYRYEVQDDIESQEESRAWEDRTRARSQECFGCLELIYRLGSGEWVLLDDEGHPNSCRHRPPEDSAEMHVMWLDRLDRQEAGLI